VWLCSGYMIDTGAEEDVQGRPGDKHSRRIYRRCQSAGVVFAEWQVIGVGGKVLSPNAPAGVGGPILARHSANTTPPDLQMVGRPVNACLRCIMSVVEVNNNQIVVSVIVELMSF